MKITKHRTKFYEVKVKGKSVGFYIDKKEAMKRLNEFKRVFNGDKHAVREG